MQLGWAGGSCSQALAHKCTTLSLWWIRAQPTDTRRPALPHPILSHLTGAGSPGIPHVSASPVINNGGMWCLWPQDLPGFSIKEVKQGLWRFWCPHPCQGFPLCRCQLGGDNEGAQSSCPCTAPRRGWGTARHPQDRGRSTDNKKELLYKTQIDPSQLM